MTAINEDPTTGTTSLFSLQEDERDALRFILDETLERWTDESEDQIKNLASDPALHDLDTLMGVAAFLGNLPNLVRTIRRKLG